MSPYSVGSYPPTRIPMWLAPTKRIIACSLCGSKPELCKKVGEDESVICSVVVCKCGKIGPEADGYREAVDLWNAMKAH